VNHARRLWFQPIAGLNPIQTEDHVPRFIQFIIQPSEGPGSGPLRTRRVVAIVGSFLLVVLIALASGCADSNKSDDDETVGNWVERSDFEGVPRSDAVSFVIGEKAYVGTGYDGTERLSDFWEYDPQSDNWKRMADFPGAARNGAVAFAVDSLGFVGTGYDGTERLKDFWAFNPSTNRWRRISDFEGTARYGAVAFATDGAGYAGTGDDGTFLKDFWRYDPAEDLWTQINSLGGAKRRDGVAFVVDGKGYVCTGVNNGTYEDDLWEYDPAGGQWTKKRAISDATDDAYDDDYASIVGVSKAAFAVDGKGYIATGGKSAVGQTVWEYDPGTDLWEAKTPLEASARIEAVGFAVSGAGFVATGRSSSYYFDDLWGFHPEDEQVDLDKKGVTAP
jgi:hypothetical protein